MEGNILQKIKKHGIVGSIKVVELHAAIAVNNKWFYYYKKHKPMDEHLIVLESEGDLSDNAFALYDYMRHNDYLKMYHVVWLVDHIEDASELQKRSPGDFPNTEFVQKIPQKVNKRWAEVLATCKWYIYDHSNLLAPFVKRERQTIVNLWHGCGYKAAKGANLSKVISDYDILIATGPLAAKEISGCFNEPVSKSIITGYPRLDYLFQDDKKISEKIDVQWHFDKYRKVIFWMPTFRQSYSEELSENYLTNETGLPLFESEYSLKAFSDFLKEQNALVVLKVHHLQANLPIFKKQLSNILIVKDEMLHDMGIQLYQFIGYADALISDYSSISKDFLILNKPIIFTLDDYEEYKVSRGLFPENAIDYMKGYHVYSIPEIEKAIKEIIDNKDIYKPEREKILSLYHAYLDGNSSQRVLDAIGIEKVSC